ncbi:MAG: CvpA family protein [Panacagrimonas sp.]
MNWTDYAFVAIVVLSALVGFLRGFTREFFGLATWILAIILSVMFGEELVQVLEGYIDTPVVRAGVAYGGLFLLGLLIGGILTALLATRVRESQFSSADRTLGGGLGLVRGILIIALGVLLTGMTSMRESPWWKESALIAPAEVLADGLRVLIPESWLARLKSDPQSDPAVKSDPAPEELSLPSVLHP